MSTVRDEITGQTLANEVMLERASHSGSFFLVEGSSDANLFKGFTNSDHCSIVVCIGWGNLVQAINILTNMGCKEILGFCDRDYRDMTDYPEYNGFIVFTDENDLETQIICSEALEKVLNEYGTEDRVVAELAKEGVSSSELLLRWSQATGALRLSSAQNGWNLKFDGMKYKFIDINSPELCPVETVQYVFSRTTKNGLPSIAAIQDIVKNCIATTNNNKLANGHDCVAVLGRALRNRFGNTNQFNSPKRQKDLAKILRISYEFAFFQKTLSFQKIRNWEHTTGYTVLKETV